MGRRLCGAVDGLVADGRRGVGGRDLVWAGAFRADFFRQSSRPLAFEIWPFPHGTLPPVVGSGNPKTIVRAGPLLGKESGSSGSCQGQSGFFQRGNRGRAGGFGGRPRLVRTGRASGKEALAAVLKRGAWRSGGEADQHRQGDARSAPRSGGGDRPRTGPREEEAGALRTMRAGNRSASRSGGRNPWAGCPRTHAGSVRHPGGLAFAARGASRVASG
jgi:hypothetical protein